MQAPSEPQQTTKQPTFIQAFIPIIVLICILSANVIIMGTEAIKGPNQIGLLLAGAAAGIISIRLGHTWKQIEKSILRSINSAMGAILILLMIGALSGTWLLSGIVPAMIYYGLKIITPSVFLLAACVSCAIISIATGSSWTTIATIGIALLGIGKTLGFHEGITAGAIISGAYFGDKMSPLSDTTNLAPAMAGTDLFTHIRYMVYTTLPSILITIVIFGIWGVLREHSNNATNTDVILHVIQDSFYIGPVLFIVPVIVIYMIIKKIPALPALFVGSLLGGIFAIIFQPHIIQQVANREGGVVAVSFVGVIKAMSTSIHINTNNAVINELLTSKGMFGMLNTVWLILCAMIFGGIMESSGLLLRIAQEVIRFANSTGSLISATAATCVFFNLTASDQYMSIAVPGRMYSKAYRQRKLKPEVLSRTLEDSGTVTSVLIPWNTCGATQSGILRVDTLTYAPFTFFCIISPFMTILQAYLNFNIRKISNPPKSDEIPSQNNP